MITVKRTEKSILADEQKIKVGEKIGFSWNGVLYWATCCRYHLLAKQGPSDSVMACLFDDCIVKMPMDYDNPFANFEDSALYEWLHTEFLTGFDQDMLERIADVTIPSVKDIFRRVDNPYAYDLFIKNYKVVYHPFEMMYDDPRNKIAFFADELLPVRYWLSDFYQASSGKKTYANGGVDLAIAEADVSKGVRPLLILRQK